MMLAGELLQVNGGSNHVDTGVAGGQRGSNHVNTGVAGGQLGSNHVDTGVAGFLVPSFQCFLVSWSPGFFHCPLCL